MNSYNISPVDGFTQRSTLLNSAAFSRSATSTPQRALLNALLAFKARSLPTSFHGAVAWKPQRFWFLETNSGFLVPCSPCSDGRPSRSFVERCYRRFTGSGGGAINGRRRCLSGCLVIYRTLHQFLMTATLCLQLSVMKKKKKTFPSSNRCQKCLTCFQRFHLWFHFIWN